MLVEDITCKTPVSIEASATITEAARLMDREVVGAVVVVEGTHPVGIVTRPRSRGACRCAAAATERPRRTTSCRPT
jgi:signal-transduction protein with cAMP-binding, CBS, and nucleotidyltransferase domain